MTIFETEDYRSFLKAWIRGLPKHGRGEVNKIAAVLGVNPTVVSQTLSGVRDFTPEQVVELTEYMGLNELESDTFTLLVSIEKAGSVKLRTRLRAKLEKLRAQSLSVSTRIREHRLLSDNERAQFYSSYLYPAVRLYCDVDGGQTLEAICARFELSRAKAQEMLTFLVGSHLCIETAGRYSMGPQVTHLEASSPFITKHHTNWRVKAIQRAEDLGRNELMYSGPMVLARADFERLREKMVGFINEVIEEVRPSKSEDVACLNLDFFWIKK